MARGRAHAVASMDVRRPGRGQVQGSRGPTLSRRVRTAPGKDPGAAAEAPDRPYSNVEHAAGPSTKTNRGGPLRNGMWGVCDGNTALTRSQGQSCEGPEPHERCRDANSVPARPRRFEPWPGTSLAKNPATNGRGGQAPQRLWPRAIGQVPDRDGRRTLTGVMRKTARAKANAEAGSCETGMLAQRSADRMC